MQKAELQELATTGWLSEQTPAFCDWIAQNGTWREYRRYESMFEAGEPAAGLLGIADGLIDITYPGLDDKTVIVTREGKGFWVGDLALLSQKERLISAHAGRHTRALFVPRAAILSGLREDPSRWHCFYRLTYENLTITLNLLSEAVALSAKARLARRLRHLADPRGEIAISQQALAELLGLNRSRLQRALASLTEAGAIATGYNRIQITDADALDRLSRT